WLVEYQWSNLARTTNGGSSFDRSRAGLDAIISDSLGPDANYLFVTPFAMDPAPPHQVWLGGSALYRSGPAGAVPWSKAGASALPGGGLVSAVTVSARSPQVVVAGTTTGDVLWTGNANDPPSAVTFQSSRPREGWVTSVALDPRADSVLYATYGNFGGAHVYRSIDGGASWQTLDGSGTGALPDIPVHSLVVDPEDSQRLYLGTDLGVMTSIDGGRSWMSEETGFGPAVTMWLSAVRTPTGQQYLFAFTHGRGAWRVALR
ncbi:MAG: WD40/YVTN/BNR-like repeat-containing protein, partial [Vicinamibacterales bacterium]